VRVKIKLFFPHLAAWLGAPMHEELRGSCSAIHLTPPQQAEDSSAFASVLGSCRHSKHLATQIIVNFSAFGAKCSTPTSDSSVSQRQYSESPESCSAVLPSARC
jgi:hypothetical protein